MNLIEQLGGYEKAKECLNTPTARECVKEELRSALLQYRREHNIFEVGDKVIRLDHDVNHIYSVQKVELDTITIFRKKKANASRVWGTWLSPIHARHATPEEIQAGRRL